MRGRRIGQGVGRVWSVDRGRCVLNKVLITNRPAIHPLRATMEPDECVDAHGCLEEGAARTVIIIFERSTLVADLRLFLTLQPTFARRPGSRG